MPLQKVFVVPAEGAQVRKLENMKTFVKPEGEFVSLNIFYRRRVNRGELIISEPPKEVKKEEPEKKKSSKNKS